MEHKLKILSEYYEAILQGRKTFEVRKDDRPFNEGDTLVLQEIVTPNSNGYTGREMTVEVTYILRDNKYVKDGFCIMSIKIKSANKARYYHNKPSQRFKCATAVQPVNQWISVEDRLPDNGVEVIVNEVDMGITIGWYDTNAEEFQCDAISPIEVTHWMPLPEPPQD